MPNLVTLLPFIFELSLKNTRGQNDPPRAKVKGTIPPCSKLFFMLKLYVKIQHVPLVMFVNFSQKILRKMQEINTKF